jgi:hypothetical protein
MTPLGRRLARLLAVLLLIAMAGCSPGDTGTVTGGIIPCVALAIAGEPHFAAGTVTVLIWKSLSTGARAESAAEVRKQRRSSP